LEVIWKRHSNLLEIHKFPAGGQILTVFYWIAGEYTSGQWTWVSGSNSPDQSGTCGTLGTPGSSTVLGARHYSVDWVDSSGNFRMFSDYGFDSTGTLGDLNDMWRYEP